MLNILSNGLFSQTVYGTLSGNITDDSTGEYLGFVSLSLSQQGVIKYNAISDENGFYTLKPIVPGVYDLHVSFVSHQKQNVNGIKINANNITVYHIKLKKSNITLPITDITYEPPMIEPGKIPAMKIEDDVLKKIPIEGIFKIVDLTPGVINGSFRGQRLETTAYYVDGVKIIGDLAVPKLFIREMSVYAGALPAEYGDVLGGVVVIVTKSGLE